MNNSIQFEDLSHIVPSNIAYLHVIVGSEPRHFKAVSEALRARSPVLRDTIAQLPVLANGTKQLRLPDFNPEAFKVLLYTIHSQLVQGEIPSLQIDQMYNLALMAEKYGLMDVLRDYARVWCQSLNWAVFKSRVQAYQEKGLKIALVFGVRSLYNQLLIALVAHTSVTDNGELVWDAANERTKSYHRVDLGLLPAELGARILAEMKARHKELREELHSFLVVKWSLEPRPPGITHCQIHRFATRPVATPKETRAIEPQCRLTICLSLLDLFRESNILPQISVGDFGGPWDERTLLDTSLRDVFEIIKSDFQVKCLPGHETCIPYEDMLKKVAHACRAISLEEKEDQH